MKRPLFIFPPTPSDRDESILQPSGPFKKAVFKVILSLWLFATVYLLLLTAAVALAAGLIALGIYLITVFPRIFTIVVGVGLAGIGLLVLYFLVKFLFKSNKADRSGMREITESDHPALFSFIQQVSEETQTPAPKKVFLSADINAGVFYDSTFLSMFFPVKKNLVIGLGMINVVNMSELKAILAHEFGHFSQKSLRLSSYVYTVNHVLYDMLYENDSFGETLSRLSSTGTVLAFFTGITVGIVRVIQAILRQVFKVVQKSYSTLSREMEFHADAVAAYVSGSAPLISSLRRMDAAGMCYNKLFEKYGEWSKEPVKPNNLYPQFSMILHHFAGEFNIPVQHGLPQVTAEALHHFDRSRLIIKNQWASHPSTDDREAFLNQLNLSVELVHDSPWALFRDPDKLQLQMTEFIYKGAEFPKEPTQMNLEQFSTKYLADFQEWSFHEAYKGLYDDRNHAEFDPDAEALLADSSANLSFDELLTLENAHLGAHINAVNQDIEVLTEIEKGNTGIKTFDFEGQKYKWKKAGEIRERMQTEVTALEAQIVTLDKQLFHLCYLKAQEVGKADGFLEQYRHLFKIRTAYEKDSKGYFTVVNALSPIYSGEMDRDTAIYIVKQLKSKEVNFRKRLKQMLTSPTFTPYLTDDKKKALQKYLSKKRRYLFPERFNDPGLDILGEALATFWSLINERYFKTRKEVLEYQVQFLPAGSQIPPSE